MVGTSKIGIRHFAFLVLSVPKGPASPGELCLLGFVLHVGQPDRHIHLFCQLAKLFDNVSVLVASGPTEP